MYKVTLTQENYEEAFQTECCLQDFQLHKGKRKISQLVSIPNFMRKR